MLDWKRFTTDQTVDFFRAESAHLGGFPGSLRRLLGLWAEKTDYLYDDETNRIVFAQENPLGLSASATVRHVCERIHAKGAEIVATYEQAFYAWRARHDGQHLRQRPGVVPRRRRRPGAWVKWLKCGLTKL